MANKYWVGGTGNWDNSTTHWSDTSGGSGDAVKPGSNDSVFFDENSGGGIVTPTSPYTSNCFVWKFSSVGFTGTFSTGVIYASGDTSLGVSFSNTAFVCLGLNNQNIPITSNGFSFGDSFYVGYVSSLAGSTFTFTLNDDLVTNVFNFSSISNAGTTVFNANNHNVTSGFYRRAPDGIGNPPLIINMGTGTWTATSNSTSVWNMQNSTDLTINPSTSTFKVINSGTQSNSFNGYDKTYNNLWFTSNGNGITTILGSNTFNNFKDDGSEAHTLKFTNGTTQTVNTFNVSGTSGKLITLNSDNTATHSLVNSGGGPISVDYLNIQHSVATPLGGWYAGTHSTDNQSTETEGSGWIFTIPPNQNSGGFLGLM